MRTRPFILPATERRELAIRNLGGFIRCLDPRKSWMVTVEENKKRRSNQQNAYLWGCVYPTIIEQADLQGWDAEDLHEYFLGEHYGWETCEGFGTKRKKPMKRSSKMSTLEFEEHAEFIKRKMAHLGVYIPDPNESYAA